MAATEDDTFLVVVILPDGYTASADEVKDAITEQLNRYTPGARVAARGIEEHGWATALLECNVELENVEPGDDGTPVIVHD